MSRQIRSSSGLPLWFRAEKYHFATQLDSVGWYEQLEIRGLCHELVLDSGSREDFHSCFECEWTELLEAVRAEPQFLYRGTKFQDGVEDWMGLNYPATYHSEYPPGFFGITPFDIRKIVSEWSPKLRKEFIRWLDNDSETSTRLARRAPRPSVNWAFKPLKSSYATPIQINANFPDKVLQESLDRYISEQREVLGSAHLMKQKRSNTFNEWCDSGLLQYLDLSIWALQNDVKITNKVFANGIFLGSIEKGEENIRTTTRKHAAIVLNPSAVSGLSLAALRAYAQLEGFSFDQQSE